MRDDKQHYANLIESVAHYDRIIKATKPHAIVAIEPPIPSDESLGGQDTRPRPSHVVTNP